MYGLLLLLQTSTNDHYTLFRLNSVDGVQTLIYPDAISGMMDDDCTVIYVNDNIFILVHFSCFSLALFLHVTICV